MKHNDLLRICGNACLNSYSQQRPLGWKRYRIGMGIAFDVRFFNGGEVILCVRGTDEADDWHRNVSMNRDTLPHGYAHAGFTEAAELILNRIATLKHERIHFTGHSMGGAVATILSYLAKLYGMRVGSLVTLGSPRCVNKPLGKAIDSWVTDSHVRIVNGNDVVPRVPLPIRYRHCGEMLYLYGGTHLWNPGYLQLTARRLFGWRPGDSVREHMAWKYVNNISHYLKGTER